MPTYEYECTKCKKKFEAFQKMTDKPLQKCPHCGAKPKKLISRGSGIIFKGSGFYATDYRSASYKKAQNKDKKSTKPPCGADPGSCKGCKANE
jgi:putative FmdB family regulatory protein